MTQENLLDEALEAWRYARTSLIAEAEGVPDDGYGFRPHPQSRTLAELLVHVAESGCMMAGELSRADGDFTRKPFEELVAEHTEGLVREGSPAEIRAELERTLNDGMERLRAAGEAQLLRPIRQFDGIEASRLSWMYHGIAHEEYHRGQVALYARLQGLVPVLTRAIHGSDAR
ncbi:MAG: DinB family protein [Gemmatimonadota bacterium]|nr:DinB family protein [Gemmatimonadota bacterium]